VGIAALVGSVLGTAWAPAAHAQTVNEVRVDGRAFRGTILEVRPRVSVRLRLADGDELSVPWSEVVSIDGTPRETLEAGTPRLLTREEAARAAPRTHWYGWQTLLVDAGSVVLTFTGAGAPVGIVAYIVGPPVVHAVHGQGGPAVGSALLRLTLPLALAVAGLEVANELTPPNSGGNGLGNAYLGLFGGAFVGVAAASAIDASVLAWEPQRPVPTTRGAMPAPPSIAITPMIAPASDLRHATPTGGLAIIGSF
jgi:hypothetical protein